MFNKRITVSGENIVELFDTGECEIILKEGSSDNATTLFNFFKDQFIDSTETENNVKPHEIYAQKFYIDKSGGTSEGSLTSFNIRFTLNSKDYIIMQKGTSDRALLYTNDNAGTQRRFITNSSFPKSKYLQRIIAVKSEERINDSMVLRFTLGGKYRDDTMQIIFNIESKSSPLQRIISFFRKSGTDNQPTFTGLMSGNSQYDKIDQETGRYISNTAHQYLIKANNLISNENFPFLSIFLGIRKPESYGNTEAERAFYSKYIEGDYTSREMNFNRTLSVPKNKVLKRGELTSEYKVFYLNLQNTSLESQTKDIGHYREPLALGSTDYFPIAYRSDGRKISQKRVCMIRDSVGKNIFILLPLESDEAPEVVILQSKSYFEKTKKNNILQCNKIEKELTNPFYTLTFTQDEDQTAVDPELFVLSYLDNNNNNVILDNSFYFIQVEKEKIDVDFETDSGKEVTLVSRRNRKISKNNYLDYNKEQFFTSLPSSGSTVPTPVQQRNIIVNAYLGDFFDSVNSSRFKLVRKDNFNDFYSTEEMLVNNNIANNPITQRTKNSNTALRREFDFYAFDENGYKIPFAYKGSYSENCEFIPRFNSRRTLIVNAKAKNVKNVGSVDFVSKNIIDIRKVEKETKILSMYERYDNLEEYDCFTKAFTKESGSTEETLNNEKEVFIFNEDAFLRSLAETTCNKYELTETGGKQIDVEYIYQYPPYTDEKTRKYYPTDIFEDLTDTESGDSIEIIDSFSSNSTEWTSLYQNDFLVNDPEYISYNNERELKNGSTFSEREIYLYEKNILEHQINTALKDLSIVEPFIEYVGTSNKTAYFVDTSLDYYKKHLLDIEAVYKKYQALRNNETEGDSTYKDKITKLTNHLKKLVQQLDYLKGCLNNSKSLYKESSPDTLADNKKITFDGSGISCSAIFLNLSLENTNETCDFEVTYSDQYSEYITAKPLNGSFTLVPSNATIAKNQPTENRLLKSIEIRGGSFSSYKILK